MKDQKKKTDVIFVVGPAACGKTAVMEGIAGKHLKKKKKAAFIFENIMELLVRYEAAVSRDIGSLHAEYISDGGFKKALSKLAGHDSVFVDTPSLLQESGAEKVAAWMDEVPDGFRTKVYLVLPATMKYRDMKNAVDRCRKMADKFRLVFTMLDETADTGNVADIMDYAGMPAPYAMTSRKIPEGLKKLDMEKILERA